jgi:hypothetical protein
MARMWRVSNPTRPPVEAEGKPVVIELPARDPQQWLLVDAGGGAELCQEVLAEGKVQVKDVPAVDELLECDGGAGEALGRGENTTAPRKVKAKTWNGFNYRILDLRTQSGQNSISDEQTGKRHTRPVTGAGRRLRASPYPS